MTTAETLMVPETVAEARTGFRTWLAENRASLENRNPSRPGGIQV